MDLKIWPAHKRVENSVETPCPLQRVTQTRSVGWKKNIPRFP